MRQFEYCVSEQACAGYDFDTRHRDNFTFQSDTAKPKNFEKLKLNHPLVIFKFRALLQLKT